MQLLYVLPYVPSLIRVRPFNFIRQLAVRHDVTVLATGSRRETDDVAPLREHCRAVHFVPHQTSASLRNCAVATLTGEPLQAAYCRSSALATRLATLLRDNHFDVVHVEHLRAAHLCEVIPDEVPSVFDAVDCISLLQERTLHASHSMLQRGLALLELSRTRHYEAQLMRRFDAVIATSPGDAAALERLSAGTHVRVIPNGVDLEYFQPRWQSPQPATLVFSGKMSYHANVSAVLWFASHVLPLVRARRPDVQFMVIGAAPPPSVRALARDPAITVTGYVPDIRQQLGTATLAVCPVTVKVGIQNKILEAMAMGIPVVASRWGAEGLAARDAEDLLVGDTAAELAAHILHVLEDAELQNRLSRAGRRYVERHHRWSALTRALEETYAGVVAPS